MTDYFKRIDDLNGYAYDVAIDNVAEIISQFGGEYAYDYGKLEEVCRQLDVKFDEHGEIIR